jgi:alpha-beta hydrolase superfamily lysophospholipase
MKNIEAGFKGAKGLKIYYQVWMPDTPKAIVQIVHGFAEHSGRYLNVVNDLVPLGYAVYADDHRGHGRSEGMRNYVDSFDQFIEDEKILYDILKEKHPDLPVFLLGHSMGSLISIHVINEYENLYEGLILSGTGISAGDKLSKILKFMAKLMGKIAPKFKISSGLDASMLSHDPEVVKAYQEDPHVYADKITARLGWEMLKSFEDVLDVINKFKLPLLIQCGSEDTLIKGAEEELKNAFKMKDKTINIYDGLYHEVYNELEKDRKIVLKDLSDWLEKHV